VAAILENAEEPAGDSNLPEAGDLSFLFFRIFSNLSSVADRLLWIFSDSRIDDRSAIARGGNSAFVRYCRSSRSVLPSSAPRAAVNFHSLVKRVVKLCSNFKPESQGVPFLRNAPRAYSNSGYFAKSEHGLRGSYYDLSYRRFPISRYRALLLAWTGTMCTLWINQKRDIAFSARLRRGPRATNSLVISAIKPGDHVCLVPPSALSRASRDSSIPLVFETS